MPDRGVGLIGDIGATNARFALVQPDGTSTTVRVYALADYASLADALDAYLAEESPRSKPLQAVLAVASPVTGDEVTLINHPWTFSVDAIRRQFGLKRLRVVNDFAANAAAIPQLRESDRLQVGGGEPASYAPIGIIGPGSGLGVSALAFSANMPVPIATEGGHVTMAPATARESAILDALELARSKAIADTFGLQPRQLRRTPGRPRPVGKFLRKPPIDQRSGPCAIADLALF